jgi:Tol biopolymer transport system component
LQGRDFDWSPDGRSLIYAANRDGVPNIWRTDVDGGETRLTDNGDKSLIYLDPAYSHDGSSIAWLVLKLGPPSERRWMIKLLRGGDVSDVYQSERPLRLIGWDASGNDLVLQSVARGNDTVRRPVNVEFLEVGVVPGSISRRLAEKNDVYLHSAALSRDRRTLAFVSRTESGDAVNILPLAGGAAKTLAAGNDPRVFFASLAFAPDGKTLYYGKQANWQVISSINNFK